MHAVLMGYDSGTNLVAIAPISEVSTPSLEYALKIAPLASGILYSEGESKVIDVTQVSDDLYAIIFKSSKYDCSGAGCTATESYDACMLTWIRTAQTVDFDDVEGGDEMSDDELVSLVTSNFDNLDENEVKNVKAYEFGVMRMNNNSPLDADPHCKHVDDLRMYVSHNGDFEAGYMDANAASSLPLWNGVISISNVDKLENLKGVLHVYQHTAEYTEEDLADMGMTREELAAVMGI